MADERPMKKRRIAFCDEDDIKLMQCKIASLKKRVEKVAAEARDVVSALEELLQNLHETQ